MFPCVLDNTPKYPSAAVKPDIQHGFNLRGNVIVREFIKVSTILLLIGNYS